MDYALKFNHMKIGNLIKTAFSKAQIKLNPLAPYIPSSKMDGLNIRNLVFQGGGVKGIAYVGAIGVRYIFVMA